MTIYIIMTFILLILVTPFSVSVRSFASSISSYSATNLTLFNFLRPLRFRLKIDQDNIIKYIANGHKAKDLINEHKEKHIKKHKYKVSIRKLVQMLNIKNVDVSLRYGVQGDAMKTAVNGSIMCNSIYYFTTLLNIKINSMNFVPDYDNDTFEIDFNVKNKLPVMQILIICLSILMTRRKNGKYRKND